MGFQHNLLDRSVHEKKALSIYTDVISVHVQITFVYKRLTVLQSYQQSIPITIKLLLNTNRDKRMEKKVLRFLYLRRKRLSHRTHFS